VIVIRILDVRSIFGPEAQQGVAQVDVVGQGVDQVEAAEAVEVAATLPSRSANKRNS